MRVSTSTSALVHQVVDEIWNLGYLELADERFAADYVNHGGLIPDVISGPESIKLAVALYRAAFPTFHIAIAELSSDGDMTVLRWVAHRSPPSPEETTPRHGGMRGITRCRIRNGKIVESWTVRDSRVALFRTRRATQKEKGTAAEATRRTGLSNGYRRWRDSSGG